MRVAVLGASGLVGTAVVERLAANRAIEVRPLIRSDASAWRLIRRADLDLRQVDVLDKDSLLEALSGCSHVVNCVRGSDQVMSEGLRRLIAACRRLGVQRLVHLSSIAVYGDPPPPESVDEGAPAAAVEGTYGWTKLKQDETIAKSARDGLPAIALCPPNITGPHSYFLLQILEALRGGTLALLRGPRPCVVVDVSNLAFAVELALNEGIADGRRYFVTNDDDLTWDRLVADLVPCGVAAPPSIEEEELAALPPAPERPSANPLRTLKHLVSSEVRRALRADPLLARMDSTLRGLAATLPKALEDRLRRAVEGPVRVPRLGSRPAYNAQLCRQQLRGVRHSCARAKSELGYAPVVDHGASMRDFCNWYRSAHGMDTEWWPLLGELAAAR